MTIDLVPNRTTRAAEPIPARVSVLDHEVGHHPVPAVAVEEAPIDEPGCTLVQMATAQGEGVVRRSERRMLEQTFVRIDGVWKIDATALRSPA